MRKRRHERSNQKPKHQLSNVAEEDEDEENFLDDEWKL